VQGSKFEAFAVSGDGRSGSLPLPEQRVACEGLRKSAIGHTTPFTPKSGLPCSVNLCIDDHGSLVIFRSVSVRPIHLFDPYFDHDY